MPYLPRPPGFEKRISHVEAAEVLSHYTNTTWKPISLLRQGTRTVGAGHSEGTARKLFVDIGGREFLLKQLPWYCDHRPHADGVIAVQDRLAEAGVPVARLQRTTSGDLLHVSQTTGEQRLYILQQVVTGTNWDGAASRSRSAGRTLARLHQICTLPWAVSYGASVRRENVFDIAAEALLLAADHDQSDAESDNDSPDNDSPDNGIIAELRGTVAQLRDKAASSGYLSLVQLIHGDVNPTNFVYHPDDSVAAIVDFDNCCHDHPVHDVARGLVHIGCLPTDPGSGRFAGFRDPFGDEPALAFLHGYREQATRWEEIQAVLPETAGCIAAELCALGLLDGWFDTTTFNRLERFPQAVVAWSRRLLRTGEHR